MRASMVSSVQDGTVGAMNRHAALRISYQPIVELKSDRTVSVEAFAERGGVRGIGWRDVSPESIDLCFRETLGVVETGSLRSVSVNLDACSIHSGNTESVEACVERLAPTTLVLELLEHRALPLEFGRVLNTWRSLGVCVVLDDLGVGYHQFHGRLQHHPWDGVKLDRSLTQRLCRGDLEVERMYHLLRERFSYIVAEGVEDLEIATRLLELGVPFAQGWAFGPPGELRAGNVRPQSSPRHHTSGRSTV